MSESYVSLRQIIRKNDAVLRVLTPIGSTVTATKGSIVKTIPSNRSFQDINTIGFANYYFMFTYEEYGEWTIRSTLNGEFVEDTITINTNKQYNLDLNYRTYLFKSGKSSLVDLWTSSKNASGTISINSTAISAQVTGTNNADLFAAIYTPEKQIIKTDYTILGINENFIESETTGVTIHFGLTNTIPYSWSDLNNDADYVASIKDTGGEINISNISGMYYVLIGIYLSGSATYSATINATSIYLQ